MNFNEINWFDGKNADGKFVMMMKYASGTAAFIKNESYETIVQYYGILADFPEITEFLIYNPQGEQIFSKIRSMAA